MQSKIATDSQIIFLCMKIRVISGNIFLIILVKAAL